MNPNTAGFVSYVSRFPWWVDELLNSFDYFWFVALLAWSLGLVVWWWHPRRAALGRSAWAWLPWVAGAGVIACTIEFALLNGEVGPFPKTTLDLTLGLLPLLAAAGGWWQAAAERAPRWRLAGALSLLPLVAIGVYRYENPRIGGWLTVAAVAVSTWPWWRKAGADFWSRAALASTVVLPLTSAVGPLAVKWWLYQRFLLQNASVLAAGVFQALVACVTLAGIVRHATRALPPAARRESWLEFRPFLLGAVLWTLVCLSLGALWSYQQRQAGIRFGLEQIRRVAVQLDRPLVAEALGPKFQLAPASLPPPESVAPVLSAAVPHLATGLAEPLSRVLTNTARSSRGGLKAVSILTIRDGWLVVALSSNRFEEPDRVRLARRTEPIDYLLWDHRAEYVDGPLTVNGGMIEFQRVPLVGPEGLMLGWLEFANARGGYAPFRARTAPFLATVLGSIVAALFFAQRQSLRAREVALREAAVAAESARVKTDFLAKVSHELRTPLQSILGYGDLLAQDTTSDTARARLAALRQNGEFMLRLVNDLLDLTAMEAGGFRFVEKPTPLPALVRDTVESLRPRAEARGLALHVDIAPDFPPWVAFDGERFRQILLNLAGNAVKFTERGRVDVALRALDRRADDTCAIELAVRDTGPGIPPADQARLFQPFARLDLTAKKEGTGLGLALTAALCRNAGGELTLESDGCTGACFRARLRVRISPPPAAAPRPADPFPTLRGRRLLVVDDNALVRDLFAAWLAELGATCELAADGEQALGRAQETTFDAVILDLAMPKLDGLAVARRWRAEGRTWRIVGVSAHASGGDREQALAAGMDAFLSKPVDLTALATALVAGETHVIAGSTHERLRAQLAARFREGAAGDAARVRVALASRDWLALHARAHHLKSSAGVVGDEHLYATCTQLEDAADARDPAAADAAWAACESALRPWLARS